jgi:hypothetical protein
MNVFVLTALLISAPWHFGLEVGYSAGLYAMEPAQGTYLNPNTHVYVEGSRPAIPPPGFFHAGISLEDERSIGFALDIVTHYKNYEVTVLVDSLNNLGIPLLPSRIDTTAQVPYLHTQFAWGVQKTLTAADGRVLFPLGLQLTYNWFIPAASDSLVNQYVNDLSKDIPRIIEFYNNPDEAIKEILENESRMGMRLNLGLQVAAVKVPHFSWLFGLGLDWNILFRPNGNDKVFYPEFGLSTGFRF